MQTIMEPKQVRRFADDLATRAKGIRDVAQKTHQAAVEVRAGWDDPKYRDFYALLDRTIEHLKLFSGHAERYGDYLNRKSGVVEKYLDRGYR